MLIRFVVIIIILLPVLYLLYRWGKGQWRKAEIEDHLDEVVETREERKEAIDEKLEDFELVESLYDATKDVKLKQVDKQKKRIRKVLKS